MGCCAIAVGTLAAVARRVVGLTLIGVEDDVDVGVGGTNGCPASTHAVNKNKIAMDGIIRLISFMVDWRLSRVHRYLALLGCVIAWNDRTPVERGTVGMT